MKLQNKVVIITGSSRGIGKAIALEFARQGADVVVNYKTSEKEAKEVARQIEKIGQEAIVVKADVSKEEDVKNMMEKVYGHFKRIDILVNNAGIMNRSSVEEMTLEGWKGTIDANLTSVFLCCKYVLPYMKKAKYGRIVNMASVAGVLGVKNTHYAVSKAGVIMFSRVFAKEVGQFGIRVNSISPGPIDTEMIKDWTAEKRKQRTLETPLRQLGKPEHIAKTALFLVSDDSDHITGQNIIVDGGIH